MSERGHGGRVPLLGREAIPLHGFGVVLPDGVAVKIHPPQQIEALGDPPARCVLEPCQRRLVVSGRERGPAVLDRTG